MSLGLSELEFRLEDRVAGEPLTPENVDIPTLRTFLDEIEKLIKGDESSASLEDSRIRIQEGSVRIRALVAPAVALSLLADVSKVTQTGDLDLIQPRRAKVLEHWQKRVRVLPSRSYQLPPTADHERLWITKDTQFQHGGENAWVSVEKYLTGRLIHAGGKLEPNIHLEVGGFFRPLCIGASEKQISSEKENLLYKQVTVRVQAEQNLHSRELRNARLLEFVPTSAAIDEAGLQKLWERGSQAWADVDSPSAWVDSLRGNI